MDRRYGIWCVRTAASVFGPNEAWMKDADQVWLMDDLAAAREEAERLNENLSTTKVWYSAQIYDGG